METTATAEEHLTICGVKITFINKKNAITTIVCAVIVSLGGFLYSQAYLPAEEKKIDLLQIDVNGLQQGQQQQIIQTELTKNNINNLTKNNEDFKQEIRDAFGAINQRLDKIYDRTDKTNKTLNRINNNN